MSALLVTKRYARALFLVCDNDVAMQDNCLNVLKDLSQLFLDPSIAKVLVSPVTPKDLKTQIVEYVTAKWEPNRDLINFLKVVVDARRVEVFKGLEKEFKVLVYEDRGMVEAVVKSVVALGPEDLAHIEKNLGELTGKKVELTSVTDSSLLGGIVVTIGNSVVDLSLKSRLNRLARSASV